MPFNLLLLPLLAGYLFLAKSNIRSYSTSLLQKEQLLFTAAGYGLFFLIISRCITLALLSTSGGMLFAKAVHSVAPFPFIGTALGTLALAFFAYCVTNLFVSENTAGRWLYHRKQFDPLNRILWEGLLGVKPQSRTPSGVVLVGIIAFRGLRAVRRVGSLTPRAILHLVRKVRDDGSEIAQLSFGSPKPVMLNLRDGMVIVGYVADMPITPQHGEFVTVLPLWTGYRDRDTKRVYRRVVYKTVLDSLEDSSELNRVFRLADIVSASLFVDTAFDIPDAPDGSGQELLA